MRAGTLIVAVVMATGCGQGGGKGTGAPPTTTTGDGAVADPWAPTTSGDGAVAEVVNVDASTAPVDTSGPALDWWTQGAAACPAGGKLEGAMPPNGSQLACRASTGMQEGPSAVWGADGHLLVVGAWHDGKMTGRWTILHPDGSKQREGSYLNGNQHGPWTSWHKGGQVFTQGTWVDGRADGAHVWFTVDGKEAGRSTMKLGTGQLVEWDEAGRKVRETTYVDGLAHGPMTRWHTNGVRAETGVAVRGKATGINETFDEQGRLRQRGEYRDDNRHGTWERYDEQGRITLKQRYVDYVVTMEIEYEGGQPLGVEPAPGPCDSEDGLRIAAFGTTGRDHECLQRAPHFPGFALVGGFAHDRGCVLTSYVLGCQLHRGRPPAPEVLALAGWSKAGGAARERIARAYLDEVLLRWSGGLEQEPVAPTVKAAADGTVTITGWQREPAGMTPEVTRHRMTWTFTPAGQVTGKLLETIVEKPKRPAGSGPMD